MKCELCGKEIGHHEPWMPVFPDQDPDFRLDVWPYRSGIHLDCIKEMLAALRGATLAFVKNEHEALTGERDA